MSYHSDAEILQELYGMFDSSLSDTEIAKLFPSLIKKAIPDRREIWKQVFDAKSLSLNGDHNTAIAKIIKILEMNPSEKLGSHLHSYLLRQKGVIFHLKDDLDDAIAAYDNVVSHYRSATDLTILDSVARAMVGKGIALGTKNTPVLAITIFDEMINIFKSNADITFSEQVAGAMISKGVILDKSGNPNDAIKVYDEVISMFNARVEPILKERVARALLHKGVDLQEISMSKEAEKTFDKLRSEFENSENPRILEYVAQSMYFQGNTDGAIQFITKIIYHYEETLQNEKFWDGLKQLREIYKTNKEYNRKNLIDDFSSSHLDKKTSVPSSMRSCLRHKVSFLNKIFQDQCYMEFEESENIFTVNIINAIGPEPLFSLIATLGRNTSSVWRGTYGKYPLQSSYFRNSSKTSLDDHHQRFLFALRGISNDSRLHEDDYEKDEKWALAQHYECKSPMLDWSFSPYVALFFSFRVPVNRDKSATVDSQVRVLYALNTKSITQYSPKDKEKHFTRNDLRFILPSRINNPRLISQSGLLLSMNTNDSLETILSNHDEIPGDFSLLKIYIPDTIRSDTLRRLNQMNINYRTLFPENFGASWYANMALEIDDYDPILPVLKCISHSS